MIFSGEELPKMPLRGCEIPITGGIQGKKLEDQSERRETHISNKGGSRGLLGCPITVTL